MSWYYVHGDGPEGPVDEGRMRALAKAGTIGPATAVWRKGMEEWLPAQTISPKWFMTSSPESAPASPGEANETGSEPPPIPDGADWDEEEAAHDHAALGMPDFSAATSETGPDCDLSGVVPEFVCCACGNMTPVSAQVQFEGKDICAACKGRFDRLAAEGGNVFYDDAAKQAGRQTAWQVFLGVLAGMTMLCAIGILVAWRTGHGSWAFPLRVVASTGFVAVGLACGGAKFRYGRLMLAALAFCWLGDMLLGWPGRNLFVWGLLSFLVGHIFLTAAFCVRGFSMRWGLSFVGVTFVVGCGVMMWLHSHISQDERVYVIAYLVVISVMVIFAASACSDGGGLLILLGALAFYVSDIFVARQRFVTSSPWNSMAGLPLYYAAVLMLAFSVRAERADEVKILK